MKSPRNFSLSLQPPLRGTEWNVERQARLSTIYSTNCRLSKSQLFFDIHRNFGFVLPLIRSYHLYKAISLTWISSRSFAAFPPIGNFPWKKNIKVPRSLMTYFPHQRSEKFLSLPPPPSAWDRLECRETGPVVDHLFH